MDCLSQALLGSKWNVGLRGRDEKLECRPVGNDDS